MSDLGTRDCNMLLTPKCRVGLTVIQALQGYAFYWSQSGVIKSAVVHVQLFPEKRRHTFRFILVCPIRQSYRYQIIRVLFPGLWALCGCVFCLTWTPLLEADKLRTGSPRVIMFTTRSKQRHDYRTENDPCNEFYRMICILSWLRHLFKIGKSKCNA